MSSRGSGEGGSKVLETGHGVHGRLRLCTTAFAQERGAKGFCNLSRTSTKFQGYMKYRLALRRHAQHTHQYALRHAQSNAHEIAHIRARVFSRDYINRHAHVVAGVRVRHIDKDWFNAANVESATIITAEPLRTDVCASMRTEAGYQLSAHHIRHARHTTRRQPCTSPSQHPRGSSPNAPRRATRCRGFRGGRRPWLIPQIE